ncbi:MAG: trehalase-like domain-containing protein, partial [Hyphomonadaceae bacterium]
MANTTHGDLDLAPVGNCAASALIDRYGRYVWACTPRVDGDPFFSALLSGEDPASETARGIWAVDLEGLAAAEQSYARNTAILTTRLTDEKGGVVEIVDFCPRYKRLGRVFRPIAFVRIVRPVSGSPRIRMRLAPTADWGARDAERTWGSNHIRYLGSGKTLRLTTNAPVSHVLNARSYRLEQE